MGTPTRSSIQNKLRDSLTAIGYQSQASESHFCDSPTLSRRDVKREKSLEGSRTGKSGVGLSLSQAKIERWSLVEKLKVLESQLTEMDSISKENIRLHRVLQESEDEKLEIRNKFAAMNDRLKEFLVKEQAERSHLEAELSLTLEENRVLKLDQGACHLENAKVQKEMQLVQNEMLKMRQLNASCIDRSVHERITSDLKQESEQLRASLAETVSQTIYERALKQITDMNDQLVTKSTRITDLEHENIKLSHEIARLGRRETESSRVIEKLRSELSDLEDSNASFRQRLVQVERMSTATVKEDQISMSCLREELKISEKRITEFLSDLGLKAERERRFQLESGMARKSIESVRQDKLRLVNKVKTIREEMELLKISMRNASLEQNNIMTEELTKIQHFYNENLSQFSKGVWRMLQHFNLVDQLEGSPATLTDLVLVLKAVLGEISCELNTFREDIFLLKTDLGRKESQIVELTDRLSKVVTGKREDDFVLNEVRQSIESIESVLRARPGRGKT
jgi:chromosome segregation ATPase